MELTRLLLVWSATYRKHYYLAITDINYCSHKRTATCLKRCFRSSMASGSGVGRKQQSRILGQVRLGMLCLHYWMEGKVLVSLGS